MGNIRMLILISCRGCGKETDLQRIEALLCQSLPNQTMQNLLSSLSLFGVWSIDRICAFRSNASKLRVVSNAKSIFGSASNSAALVLSVVPTDADRGGTRDENEYHSARNCNRKRFIILVSRLCQNASRNSEPIEHAHAKRWSTSTRL